MFWNSPALMNVRKEMKPILVLTSLFGLTRYETPNRRDMTCTQLIHVTNIIRTVMLVLMFCHCTQWTNLLEMFGVGISDFVNMHTMLLTIMATVVISYGLVAPGKFSTGLNRLTRIDNRLHAMKITIPYTGSKQILWLWIVLLINYTILDIAVIKIYLPWAAVVNVYMAFLKSTEIILSGFHLLFVATMLLIRVRFNLVNEQLAALADDDADDDDLDVDFTTEFCAEVVAQLQRLNAIHQELRECCRILNAFFEFPVLFVVARCFGRMLLNAFFALQCFSRSTGMPPFACAFSHVFWAARLLMEIYCYVYVAEVLQESGNKPLVMLYRIRSAYRNAAVKDAVLLFGTDIHQNSVRLVICGMFKLENDLISKMIGALTAYLIVMFQFLMHQPSTESHIT